MVHISVLHRFMPRCCLSVSEVGQFTVESMAVDGGLYSIVDTNTATKYLGILTRGVWTNLITPHIRGR